MAGDIHSGFFLSAHTYMSGGWGRAAEVAMRVHINAAGSGSPLPGGPSPGRASALSLGSRLPSRLFPRSVCKINTKDQEGGRGGRLQHNFETGRVQSFKITLLQCLALLPVPSQLLRREILTLPLLFLLTITTTFFYFSLTF